MQQLTWVWEDVTDALSFLAVDTNQCGLSNLEL